jgi:hypothetical protein
VRKVLAQHSSAPLSTAVRALLAVLVATPSAPELHRELVEHVDLTRRREVVRELRVALAQLFAGFLTQRRGELRALPDEEATLFVLEHAIEAATHAAAFYRPDGLSLERALDAITDMVVRTLLPG